MYLKLAFDMTVRVTVNVIGDIKRIQTSPRTFKQAKNQHEKIRRGNIKFET